MDYAAILSIIMMVYLEKFDMLGGADGCTLMRIEIIFICLLYCQIDEFD